MLEPKGRGVPGAPVKPGHDSGEDIERHSRGYELPEPRKFMSLEETEGAGNAGRRCTRALVCN